jgi:hypothetical protein
VTGVTAPGSGGTVNWTMNPLLNGSQIWAYFGINNTSSVLISDTQLRATSLMQGTATGQLYSWAYDTANNVITHTDQAFWLGPTGYPAHTTNTRTTRATYGPHGNVLTTSVDGFPTRTPPPAGSMLPSTSRSSR